MYICIMYRPSLNQTCDLFPAGKRGANACYSIQKPGTARYSKSIDFSDYNLFKKAVPALSINNFAWRITGNFMVTYTHTAYTHTPAHTHTHTRTHTHAQRCVHVCVYTYALIHGNDECFHFFIILSTIVGSVYSNPAGFEVLML